MAKNILQRIDKKFYKKCFPEETIHRIREILYKCGILIMELSDTQDGFYHSHFTYGKTVLVDMSTYDPLQYYDLPTCPHCEHCSVSDTCYLTDVMQIVKSVQKKHCIEKPKFNG